MPADILLYALVAAGLVFWLRNILGTRHEDEPQRPNPFTAMPTDNKAQGDASQTAAGVGAVPLYGQNPEDMKAGFDKTMDFAETAAAGLMEIARQDRGFNLARFLTGAQDAFVLIVESFAEGDRETLKNLLAPSVYEAFDGVIAEREKKAKRPALKFTRYVKAKSSRQPYREATPISPFVLLPMKPMFSKIKMKRFCPATLTA